MSVDVLHVLPELALGGAERLVVQLVRGRGTLRAGVVCIGRPQHNALEAALAAANVPWQCLGKPRHYRPWYSLALLRLVDALRPRLLHTHRHVLPYVLPVLALRRELRCVHTVHNLARHEVRPALRPFHRLAFRLGVAPVAVSNAVAASVRDQYRVHRVEVVRNGIPLGRFAPDAHQRERARVALGYRPEDVVFVCVARLHAQKNHALLLEAFARVAADPRARLLLAGSGPLEGALERAIEAYGLADRVRLVAAGPGVPALLAASDVFVLASRWEGCPLAVMEAMASARPVVATAVGGVPELVAHGVTGLLVPSDSVDELAAALHRLLQDPARREALGASAAAHARRFFDETTMVQAYRRIYESRISAAPQLAVARA